MDVLWIVRMLPHVIGLDGVDYILAVEEGANTTSCWLVFVRAFFRKLLGELGKSAVC